MFLHGPSDSAERQDKPWKRRFTRQFGQQQQQQQQQSQQSIVRAFFSPREPPQKQQKKQESAEQREGRIFSGVRAFFEGYSGEGIATSATMSVFDLKKKIVEEGGVVLQYPIMSKITHVFCTQLSKSKRDKLSGGVKIVHPEWILCCLKEGKKLPENGFNPDEFQNSSSLLPICDESNGSPRDYETEEDQEKQEVTQQQSGTKAKEIIDQSTTNEESLNDSLFVNYITQQQSKQN